MYQRHDPREHRPGSRSDFRDYDDFQQDNFEDQRRFDQESEPQMQPRRFTYTGSANTTAARRYGSGGQWSPNWMTRGGAPEYRQNSSGAGDMDRYRRDSAWDTNYDDHEFDAQQQQQRHYQTSNPQYRGDGFYNGNPNTTWRGEFTGKGPKSYSRADQRIEEDINEQLTRHPYLDATDIEVKVKDGCATLTGTVRSKQCKRTAEDLAEDASGIKEVQNNLRVVPSQLLNSSTQQPNRPQDKTGRTH